MSANDGDAPTRPAQTPLRGGTGGFAARWPFRRKLNALVGVPLVVVALLLSYLIVEQADQARRAAAAAQLVRDSRQVAELVDRVETEYQQAILLSVRHEAATPGKPPSIAAYRRAQAVVDAQVDTVRRTFGSRLPDPEAQALREINGLSSLRGTVEESYLPADNIDPAYTGAVKALLDGLGLDLDPALAATFTGNLLDSLLRADAAHSTFETSVFSAQTGDSNALIEFINAVGADSVYSHQADRFARFATDAQADELGGIEHGAPYNTIALEYAGLQVDPSGLQAQTPAQVRKAFAAALETYPQYRAQAQNRLRITASLIGQIAGRADRASSDAWWRVAWLLGMALLGFMSWLAFTVAVRRSVVRPVQALTGAAQQVADAAGRELARVADDDADDDGPPRLRQVPVAVHDEIGELADAFNRVQATAAALLERQVLSRRNVAEMFGNVGRRVSNLTTRQLALIDAVERGETDPALLDRLYRIDHIAVRLQRNADSLMLLAGIRETGVGSGPAALTNVVRAALGQIEAYQRVRLHAETEVTVAPDIIGDLTLMLAELLENAVAFSPAHSTVEVSVRAGGDGAHVEITDHGLGMSAERLAEENARLIRRERLDLVPTKVLGLFVVGSLARRWGVEVTLTRTTGGGVTARVVVPSSLLLRMSPVGVRAGSHDAIAPAPAEPAARSSAVAADIPVAGTDVPAAARPPSPAPAATDGTGSGRPAPLPRRVPRRETAPAGAGEAPPAAGTGEQPPAAEAGETAGGPAAARPLRRRVRGATLGTTTAADAAQRAARQTARPADAEAVRSALEEFEAGVERAHRDSSHAAAARTAQSQEHLPEGAEQ